MIEDIPSFSTLLLRQWLTVLFYFKGNTVDIHSHRLLGQCIYHIYNALSDHDEKLVFVFCQVKRVQVRRILITSGVENVLRLASINI